MANCNAGDVMAKDFPTVKYGKMYAGDVMAKDFPMVKYGKLYARDVWQRISQW
jgi:hypothetical protein